MREFWSELRQTQVGARQCKGNEKVNSNESHFAKATMYFCNRTCLLNFRLWQFNEWCPEPDSNWHGSFPPQDFKSCVSTYSTIRAYIQKPTGGRDLKSWPIYSWGTFLICHWQIKKIPTTYSTIRAYIQKPTGGRDLKSRNYSQRHTNLKNSVLVSGINYRTLNNFERESFKKYSRVS